MRFSTPVLARMLLTWWAAVLGLATASGVSHEIDVVIRTLNSTALFELKNKAGVPFDKNDAIVFFAKVLDYLCANPELCL